MLIFPAIDLRDGKAVRLAQGDFARETIFNSNPVSQAKKFAAEGATWLHLVDLDGARDGISRNAAIIQQIRAETKLKIQLGGGIRTLDSIEWWLNQGIERLVLGTLALQEPATISAAVERFGTERIVVGLDTKAGFLSTHGWLQNSSADYLTFARQMIECGVTQLIYTDIKRDGMLTGPDLTNLQSLKAIGGIQVIASGGVSSYADLLHLTEIKIDGVIIGQALYTGVLSLPTVFQQLRRWREC